VYGRHGKTIDPARHACGVCRGRLLYLGRFGRDGRPQATPAPIARSPAASGAAGGGVAAAATSSAARPRGGGGGNAYSSFVKERYASVQATLPKGTPGKEVMRRLAVVWREEKAVRAAAAATAGAAGPGASGEGNSSSGGGGGGVAEEDDDGLPSLIRRLQL
jgi:hypothetical protein